MSIDARSLLLALAEDPLISGSALATRFGVTRAAVWKQVEALRALGAPIHACAGKGYRLLAPIDLLDRHAIIAALPTQARMRFGSIEVHWQLDSTNSELLRHAQAGDARFKACLTEVQTSGRGRRGRSWHSPLGGGLALSVFRQFDSSMSAMAGLSLAVGVGVVRALEDFGYAGCGLKWPNDVYCRGRKLAGVLVELGGDALGPCHAVVGIGLNLRLDERADTHIDQAWIDLSASTEVPLPERNVLAARLLARLLEVLDQFEQSTFSSFATDFAQYDVLRGQAVRVVTGRSERDGVAVGVDQGGALRVRAANGEFVVDSGEVSVRAMAGPGA